jgi:membrane peptidoglycan carboxypeptidase
VNAITRRKTLHAARRPPQHLIPRWVAWMLALMLVGAGLGALGLGTVFAMYYKYTQDYTPLADQVNNRYVGMTEVYDRGGPTDGVFLGTLSNENGPLVKPEPLSAISANIVEATVSTEDNNFWSNRGVDPKSIARAAWENYLGGGIGTGTGGSTITQQLVKLVYLTDDCQTVNSVRYCSAPRTLQRKLKEMAFAVEVEQHYSKDQIIEWYLNQVSYGDRYVGVEAAAQGYFHKPGSELTLGEAAMLASIPAGPTAYHPRLNCVKDTTSDACVVDAQGRTTVGGALKQRQLYVLDLMVKHGRISQTQADAAADEPLLIYPAENPIKASAWIDDQVEPRLVRMCEAGILPQLPDTADCTESVHTAGYQVTTTLDEAKTEQAEAMIRQYLAAGQKAGCACYDGAIVTIEPTSGQVMVYAPNADPTNTTDPKVSGTIDQLVEINQPGSSFKPAVYLSYFDKLQKTPMSSIWDTSPLDVTQPGETTPTVITNPRPGGGGEGLITARAAMGGSQNVPAFRIAEEVGIDNVIAEAKALGVTTLDQGFDPTFYDHEAIQYGPSIATGGANIRAIDLAYMNATIANMGTMIGVPTLAKTVPLDSLLSTSDTTGAEQTQAYQQRLDFIHGNIRIPGTRALDPVTVLQVRGPDGTVVYQEGGDLQKTQVVDAASVWMVHSIMSDCTARFIIWSCGSSNNDLDLDSFMPDGTKIPTGIKTGTQQGFASPNDTLATWMNGYSRYAATAVWVVNADK